MRLLNLENHSFRRNMFVERVAVHTLPSISRTYAGGDFQNIAASEEEGYLRVSILATA